MGRRGTGALAERDSRLGVESQDYRGGGMGVSGDRINGDFCRMTMRRPPARRGVIGDSDAGRAGRPLDYPATVFVKTDSLIDSC